MQDDILEATMTPLEILLFTAKLKLNLPPLEIEKKVNQMISELNLQKCKTTPIGNHIQRGVSGGERKRTSIGVELISDPKIIFLDEPTTGLDSYNAFEVVKNLCELAELEEKIIIFTIHQPSSELFSLLHKIFILADGKTVYFGDKDNSIDFFNDHLRLNYPLNYNPFEFFIEMTNFEVFYNEKVNEILTYNKILTPAKDKDDKTRLQAYSNYIQILADIFAGKKKLILSTEINIQDDLNKSKNKLENFVLVDNNDEVFNVNLKKKENIKIQKAAYEVVESYRLQDETQRELMEKDSPLTKEQIDKIIESKAGSKGFCYEFGLLYQRNTICASRNSNILAFSLMNNLVVAIFAAILFKNVFSIIYFKIETFNKF